MLNVERATGLCLISTGRVDDDADGEGSPPQFAIADRLKRWLSQSRGQLLGRLSEEHLPIRVLAVRTMSSSSLGPESRLPAERRRATLKPDGDHHPVRKER